MEKENLYNKLVQCLRLVASPYEVQISLLPNFIDIPDEIALFFDDVFLTIPQLKIEYLFSPNTLLKINEVNELFESMSEEKFFWELEELKNNKSWEKSRELALSVLKLLNEPYEKPNLDFITWVK